MKLLHANGVGVWALAALLTVATAAVLQAATAVARACQVSRVAVAQRASALHSSANISSGVAALRRQQGSAMAAASRLAVVRAMATAADPVTKKVSASPACRGALRWVWRTGGKAGRQAGRWGSRQVAGQAGSRRAGGQVR